jgi:hypothetical protein
MEYGVCMESMSRRLHVVGHLLQFDFHSFFVQLLPLLDAAPSDATACWTEAHLGLGESESLSGFTERVFALRQGTRY